MRHARRRLRPFDAWSETSSKPWPLRIWRRWRWRSSRLLVRPSALSRLGLRVRRGFISEIRSVAHAHQPDERLVERWQAVDHILRAVEIGVDVRNVASEQ